MDTAIHSALRRPELVTPTFAAPAETARTLTVTATYRLSEAGRKASLVAGGDGRAVQRVEVQVPASRLHLVTVNTHGFARLKLSPHFELDAHQRVVRVDGPPSYDALPSTDELFRDAARNHEFERAYHAERMAATTKRRQAEQDWKAEAAHAFLSDPAQRAVLNPSPSRIRCYVTTEQGRVRFDVTSDEGPARDVPREAYKRFRADLRAKRDGKQRERTEGLHVHDEKKQTIAAWIAEHGTSEQQARQAAGLLPMDEAIEAMADQAFRALADRPRYLRRGASDLHAFLRQCPQYADIVVSRADVAISVHRAVTATTAQWALVREMQAAVPDAAVMLLVQEMAWKLDPNAPRLTHVTVLLTKKVDAVLLRREYLAPDN